VRVAIRIGYDGRPFAGFQIQPDQPTVQGEIERALQEADILPDPRRGRWQAASRTDAGVSALGNVIAFDTEARRGAILPAANAATESVWFLARADVPDDFNPRHARQRWYRYHLRDGPPRETMDAAARAFVGEHDFAAFAKEEASPLRLRLDEVSLHEVDEGILLDFRAPRFRWNMVRRMVAALVSVGEGTTPLADVRSALETGEGSFGAARSEPLFLMDVDHGLSYVRDPKADRLLEDRIRHRRDRGAVDQALTDGLAAKMDSSSMGF
jgi:tRNA pseudouridine38-40 synthase